jgi:proteasome accessory factor B
MKTATRFFLERIVALDRAIRAGKFPNAGTISRLLEVCPRTVQRDIEFLRDRLHAPLVFDSRRNGYAYSDPGYRLPSADLTEEEILTLCRAERVVEQMYRDTPFGPALARTFRKLTAGLTERVHVRSTLDFPSHSFHVSASTPLDPGLFRDLDDLILTRIRVAIRYWSASRDEETNREVDPYHLACIDNYWYLIAFCQLRGQIRMFALSRIRQLEPTGATFDQPTDFRIDDYLARSFAVLRGAEGELHRVRLRFTADAVRYVRERTWHLSQKQEFTDEGSLVLSLEVGNLRGVERWVLSWGVDCEVLEPAELRTRITVALEETLRRYSQSTPDVSSRA